MSKLTKNQKLTADKIEAGKAYSLKEEAEQPYFQILTLLLIALVLV